MRFWCPVNELYESHGHLWWDNESSPYTAQDEMQIWASLAPCPEHDGLPDYENTQEAE